MGLSLREVEGVLELLGVECCFQAVWYWKERMAEAQSDPPTATPSQVAVDEKQIEVDGEKKWLYAAIERIQSFFSRWMSTTAAARTLKRHFSTGSPRSTTSPKRSSR